MQFDSAACLNLAKGMILQEHVIVFPEEVVE